MKDFLWNPNGSRWRFMPRHLVRLTSLPALLLAGLLSPRAHSQGLPPPPGSGAPAKAAATEEGPSSFDVVSVHEHSSDDHNMSWMTRADGITMRNIQLQSLVADAYNVKMDLITGGPSWASTKGFDIEAKILPSDGPKQPKLSEAQQRNLMRALLVERFHLKAHIESKILPIYELTVTKDGPKMKLSPPQPASENGPAADAKPGDMTERGSATFGPGYLQAHAYKMPGLAGNLGYIVHRTVLDKTGLTGEYDLDLSYAPEDQVSAANDKATTGADPKPSIYAALQEQLGLKLVSTKGPVNTLVIDHVELPTAN